jgi:CheY-like chemotaxis protein/two-component sensor histidine kinase
LDEKAGHLRRADELKSSFLSDMSHEFRTPLNAILSLSRLLLDRTDGPLTPEQERQVRYIRQSGEDLLETVNDLLDLAKIEAGKVDVKATDFEVSTLFSALRGMLKPLLTGESVELVFDDAQNLPPLWNDERKVSQILRNFISNALKFTERGQVRVSARTIEDGRSVAFAVADTGIGIAPEDMEKIFEEFTQIDNAVQRRVKGTGLGLPLCRKLARLLGGRVEVESVLGMGSTFTAVIPVQYALAQPLEPIASHDEAPLVPDKIPVLIVEDDAETRLLYEKYLSDSLFQSIPAASIRQAREMLRHRPVGAIVLDIVLPGDAWGWLAELKADEATRHIPVLVVSSVEDPRKGLALGADRYAIKPVYRHWLLEQLTVLTGGEAKAPSSSPLLLIIDDQESDRYLIRRLAASIGCSLIEATDGLQGLALARERKPSLILLDLSMPGLSGQDVVERLRTDPELSRIPVVIVTSHVPGADALLSNGSVIAVMDKHHLSAGTLDRILHELGVKKTAELVGGETTNV